MQKRLDPFLSPATTCHQQNPHESQHPGSQELRLARSHLSIKRLEGWACGWGRRAFSFTYDRGTAAR